MTLHHLQLSKYSNQLPIQIQFKKYLLNDETIELCQHDGQKVRWI